MSQNFVWQAEPQGNDSPNPGGSLNLLFYSGNNSPAETGLKLSSNGQITFAAGQTFPGTAGTADPLQVREVQVHGFVPPQTAGKQYRQKGTVTFAPPALDIGRLPQRFALFGR
ncbi:MAG: hypothetical protein ABSH50_26980 [Bryobacteraceae bacterium]